MAREKTDNAREKTNLTREKTDYAREKTNLAREKTDHAREKTNVAPFVKNRSCATQFYLTESEMHSVTYNKMTSSCTCSSVERLVNGFHWLFSVARTAPAQQTSVLHELWNSRARMGVSGDLYVHH